jgi:transposase
MLRLIPKSPEHVSEVRELYHSTKDVRIRTRAQIILLAFDGTSPPAIAKIVDFDPESVRRHIKRYRDEGISGLADRERTGRPRAATPEYVDLALTTVRRRPRALGLCFSVWTLDRLLDYLEEKTTMRVSDETLRRHLRANGISFSRPQHKVSSPDEGYLEKKRRSKTHETI